MKKLRISKIWIAVVVIVIVAVATWAMSGGKKEEDITDVKIIRNVNLCHGRSHQQKNARFVEAIWSKKETRLSAVRQLAVM